MNKQQITTGSLLGLLAVLGFAMCASPVAAQVFDQGPSDPSLFDTVINIPPDPDIETSGLFGDSTSIGGGGTSVQLNIFDDGEVGDAFNANSWSEINISGGRIGFFFDANLGSEVNISGGVVRDLNAMFGSQINVSGGRLGSFDAISGSQINVSGGSLGPFRALSGSEVNISGGSFDSSSINAWPDSTINLYGTEFAIDGDSLNNSLEANTPLTIIQREVTLTGVLSDGSEFSIDLSSVPSGEDSFRFPIDPDANLTVTLVSDVLLGDCDQDGDVDFFDINPFIGLLSSNAFLAQADINQDGEVTFLDIAPLIQILAAQ